MDMKLSGTRIRELRLKLSWSQEKLAEEAGLNARTVQRAESEGSASLRTRLQLASALRVQPQDLDAVTAAGDVSAARPGAASIHYLVVLLLVSLVFLASLPAYFSVSKTSFDWIGSIPGIEEFGPQFSISDWLIASLGAWLACSLPTLYYLVKKQRHLLPAYSAALMLILALAVARAWQGEWVMSGLTSLLGISALLLLVALYVPRLPMPLLRHGLALSLGAYVFIWFFHDLALFALSVYVAARDHGVEVSAKTLPLWYVAGTVLRNLADLVQLLPAALVLALALGEKQHLAWPARRAQAMPEPPVTP